MSVRPWWHEAVIYQIYPRSFADSDGDGVGDLQGVIDHLDHVVDLGADTIWLSPFFPSPQRDFGYDVTDYCDVDPAYGTLETADALIDEAHRRGLRVLLDLVPNHTSDEHPWFIESASSRDNPRADWYLWADGRGPDGRKPPTNWRSAFQVSSAWRWHEGRRQWYLATFLPCQPDLNWRNPQVRAAMFDVVRFWLRRGVDGFRLDMYDSILKDPELRDERWGLRVSGSTLAITDERRTRHHPDLFELTRELRAVCREFDDPDEHGVPTRERILLGEVFGSPGELRRYRCDGDGLQLVFLFDFLRFRYSAGWFAKHIAEFERAFPWPDQPTYVLENHDRSRSIDRVGGDLRKARVLAAILCTARGVPTIYMGQELGMSNTYVPLAEARDPIARQYFGWVPEVVARRLPERLNRDEVRTPMQWTAGPNAGFSPPGVTTWLPVNPNHVTRNVADESSDPASLLSWYRTLLSCRRSHPALAHGRLDLLASAPTDVLGYVRSADGERIVVVANLGRAETPVPIGGSGRLLAASDPSVALAGPSVTLPCDSAALVLLDPD